MEITDDLTIQNGMVMGKVSTNKVGSECTFEVCSIEEWKEIEDEVEAYEMLMTAMWNSGKMEAYF